jgi:hypothetical protein
MSRSELRLRYIPEDEWTGDLVAKVHSDGFSGSGSAHFDRTYVKETFITALSEFPLIAEHPPTIEGGFLKNGVIDQCHLRLTVTPYDSKGHLVACVELATPVWKTASQDKQQMVTARYLTSYEAVSRFARELEAMLEGNAEEAVLQSDDA